MKQWVVALALCLGALLVAGVVVTTGQAEEESDASLTTVAADDEAGEVGHAPRDGWGPPPWVRGGEGPPPWAGRSADRPGKPDKPVTQWQQGWGDLTEQERDDLMADLAREHATGMRRWAACVGTGSGPADCERPTPPGHAKKARVR